MKCKKEGEKCDWIKVGDTVKVIDGSFSLELCSGLLLIHRILTGMKWEVVSTGNRLPTEADIPEDYSKNDTIIYHAKAKRIVFIRHHYLVPLGVNYVSCSNCGKKIRVRTEVKKDVQSKQRVVREEE